MAVLPTPRKFTMQQVFEILLRRPVDKSIIAYLTDCKTSGLENTMEMVYPTGGQGNVYIGGGFAHSRRATFNVTVATWNTDVLAVQNGTEVATGSTEITYYDVITPLQGKYFTKFIAQGAVGSEVGFIYILNSDGTYGKSYTQTQAVTTAGQFAYSTTTKELTFFSGDEPEDGAMIAVSYQFKTADNAQRVVINSDGIPPTVLVSAYGIAKDICTGELFHAVIEGQAQVDGNWTFDLAADGEPAIQNLTMEFVKGCLSKELYTFTIYTEDEGDTGKVATPVATPVGGTYPTAQTVTLTVSTPGAVMHYTLDGSDPTPASVEYTAPINIPAGATTVLKVLGVADGMNNSDVLMESYVISATKAATPVATPAGGTYDAAQTVTLTSASTGATIYYTDDGTTPSASSTQYTAAITVPAAETTNIKAIAIEAGIADSDIMDETYIIS